MYRETFLSRHIPSCPVLNDNLLSGKQSEPYSNKTKINKSETVKHNKLVPMYGETF